MGRKSIMLWEWWTSNGWKRLSRIERGVSTNVLMPCRLPGGGATIDVTDTDMALIAAAPELLEALQAVMAEWREGYGLGCEKQVRAAIAKGTEI
jgi:hypothetical protein